MDPIKLLEFLYSKPQLLAPLLLALLLWPVGKLIVRILDTILTADNLGPRLPQLGVFILLVHFLTSVLAAVYCWQLTELPAPFSADDPRTPFGPELDRSMSYVRVMFFAACSLIGLYSPHDSPALKFFGFFRPPIMLLGLASALLLVGYAAIDNPNIFAPLPKAATRFAALAWWYAAVPITAVLFAVPGFLLLKMLQGLWSVAGRIVRSEQQRAGLKSSC